MQNRQEVKGIREEVIKGRRIRKNRLERKRRQEVTKDEE